MGAAFSIDYRCLQTEFVAVKNRSYLPSSYKFSYSMRYVLRHMSFALCNRHSRSNLPNGSTSHFLTLLPSHPPTFSLSSSVLCHLKLLRNYIFRQSPRQDINRFFNHVFDNACSRFDLLDDAGNLAGQSADKIGFVGFNKAGE